MDDPPKEMHVFINRVHSFLHRRLDVAVPVAIVPVNNIERTEMLVHLVCLPESVRGKAAVILCVIKNVKFRLQKTFHICLITHTD